jgi:hypothetical protein
MIEITAIRFEGGNEHEHITHVLWRSAATALGHSPSRAIVDWLDESTDNQAVIADHSTTVPVAVVRRPNEPPYLRTRADGTWTDQLLSLPTF